MKKIALFGLAAVTFVAAVYLIRHLIRWEWHRAMFSGIAMLAGEIALAAVVILRAVRRAVEKASAPEVDQRVLSRLQQSRPPSARAFAWLQPDQSQCNVFVSILLGGGVLISAAAWLLDKLAKATSSGGLEKGLATRLARLAPPRQGFVMPDDVLLAAGRRVEDDALQLLLAPSRASRP